MIQCYLTLFNHEEIHPGRALCVKQRGSFNHMYRKIQQQVAVDQHSFNRFQK